MDWEKLLCDKRFASATQKKDSIRTPFQRDYDRIVFSSAFRRLQDKTQVHPFATSDYVRKRLTHSLEVSSVGRSLGYWLGIELTDDEPQLVSKRPTLAFDVAQIVSNACLAHDIGNPPFGHAGEKAIGNWFKENRNLPILADLNEHQKSDFEKFEGNAQGFRLITRILDSRDKGGLNLTCATLGAFIKYPSSSVNIDSGYDKYIGKKKYGFFKKDEKQFEDLSEKIGLLKRIDGSRSRSPLVFLVEAADDICYRIIDIEDGYKLGRIPFKEAEKCLKSMINEKIRYKKSDDDNNKIALLRAKAIGSLIIEVCESYKRNKENIDNGNFSKSLIDDCNKSKQFDEAKNIFNKKVLKWEKVIVSEISGSEMIKVVLDKCMKSITSDSKIDEKIRNIIPNYDHSSPNIDKVHSVADFVSGMTDSYLRNIFLKLSGHYTN